MSRIPQHHFVFFSAFVLLLDKMSTGQFLFLYSQGLILTNYLKYVEVSVPNLTLRHYFLFTCFLMVVDLNGNGDGLRRADSACTCEAIL